MRLNGPPPWDLIVSSLISVLILVLVDLSPPSMRGLSTILGLVFAIPLFGYLIVLSLFPAKSELSLRTRALLSLSVSTFLIAIVGLVLTHRGLQLNYVAIILSILTLFMATIAYARWSVLPSRRRFVLWSTRGRRPRRTPASSLLVGFGDGVVSLLCFLGSLTRVLLSRGAGTFFAAFAYIRWTALPPRNRLAARSMRGRRSWRSIANSPSASNKGQFVSLLFVLVIICALAASLYTNNAKQSLSSEKVNKVDSTSPNREDHLRINSYNIKLNNITDLSDLNASAKSIPINVEQKSAASIMAMNNVSSSGNSTPSEETPSFQDPNEKISIPSSSGEKNNQQINSEPSSSETARIPSLESSKENQTTNPADLLKNSSNEEMGLTSSLVSVSSGNETPNSEANMVGNATNSTVENQNSNSPPSLPDLYPNKPYPQIVGTPITWMVNAFDPDGDVIFYKFLLNDKAMTDWSASSSWTWNTSTVVPGDYRIKVLIRDGKHASEDSFDASKEMAFTLTQPNQRPVIEDLRPDLDSPQASGTSILWKANATDPDGDVIFYKFLLNDEAMTDWSASNSWAWNTSSIAPGDYRVKVLIRDSKHVSEDSFDASKEMTFTLAKPNQRPVIEDLRPDLDSPQASGTGILWKTNATDPDGDVIFYKFLLNDEAMTDWYASNSWAWNTSSITPGDYRIKVLIRDGKHASEDSFDASKEMTFTLTQPNQRPVIEDFRPDLDSPQAPGKSIVWTANATDPDGDVVLYKFFVNNQPATVWLKFNTFNWVTTRMPPGDYHIKVLIRDGKHASEDSFDASKEVTFTLAKPNQLPVIEYLRSDMGSPQAPGKSIAWTANSTDPDRDVISYKFLLNDKAMTDWSASNSWTWNTSSVVPGDYRIKVLVRDGKHASEDSFDASKEMAFTLTQPNQRPVIGDLRPDLDSPQASGTSILWKANAADPDGDVIFYKFLLNDEAMTDWSASNSWAWNTSSIAPGDYRVKVLIRDGKHASEDSFDASKEMSFTLTQPNQRPVIEDLRPDLDSPQASGTSILWKANAADPDGDVIFYKFLLNDKAMTDWSASNSWAWNTSSMAPGDYRIKVLIRDGKHASEDSFDASKEMTFTLTQPNQRPIIEDFRPDLDSPQAPGKSIVWTANATDPDGDVVLYKFFVNNQPATVWLKFNTFNWVTTRMPPGDYHIKVLIRDGKHASEDSFDASKEVTFTLAKPNQLPVIEYLRSDMDSPQAPGKSIAWTANSTDPDRDVISYKFLLNDKAMTDWSASNSWTWNTSSVVPGDYRIKVLIRDGKHASEDSFDASKEATFNLLASNRPPVLKSLSPVIDNPQASRKSIVWMANAEDPDGDVIFYKFLLNDKAMSDWSASNLWTWNTSSVVPGDYRVKVLIRDGKHASEDSFDAFKETTFTLKLG